MIKSQIAFTCPSCYSTTYSLSYTIREYRYYSCNSCGMLYLNNRDVSAADSKQYYDADYFKDALKENLSGYMDYAKQSHALRRNFRTLLSHINRHMSFNTSPSVLDVGCAYGFFLDEARKLGMSVQGIDVSETAIQWMKNNLDIDGTVGMSSDAPKGPFDLITAIEVIEHTVDPHAFIRDMYEQLSPEGILVIVTGANDTVTAKMLGSWWWYLNPPDHCSIFSRQALRKLVSLKGFELLEHRLIPYHWVGLNNMVLKVARVIKSGMLGNLASSLPALVVPIFHYSTQLLIARKQKE